MKPLFLLVFSSVFSIFCARISAQPLYIGELRNYKMPTAMTYYDAPLPQPKKTTTAAEKKQAVANPHHTFYPIGWSRDNRFACMIDYAAPIGQDTQHVELVVQNVLFNDVVYSWRGYYGFDESDTTTSRNARLHMIWSNKYSTLRRKLNEYNIRQPDNFDWRKGTSFKYADDVFSLATDMAAGNNEKRIAVVMTCGKGKRTILLRNNTDETPEKVIIHGTFISPYEARGVVLIELIFKSETPQVPMRQLRFVGFDLVNNFE